MCLLLLGGGRAGGGRGGGVSRKPGETKVYRRVQSTTENVNTTNETGNGVAALAHGNGTANGGRKVVVLDEPSVPPAFKSSLQAAIRLQPSEPSRYEKEGKKNGAASHQQQHGRSIGKGAAKSEKPKSPHVIGGGHAARERSSSPQKRGDRQTQSAAQSDRVVTSVSTTSSVTGNSPKKLADRKKGDAKQSPRLSVPEDAAKEDEPRQFVSSLTSSLANKKTGRLSDHKQAPHDRPTHGNATHARPQQAASGRGARYQTRDMHASYRKVEDTTESNYPQLSEKNLLMRKTSFSRPLSRKNSSESLSSMRSGRSERSERSDYDRGGYDRGGGSRWDRKPKYGGDYRQDDYCHSTGNDRGARYAQNGPSHHSDDIAPVGRFARSMSDSSRSQNEAAPPPAPAPAQPSHVMATTRSSQDVRFQKSALSVSAHGGSELHGRPLRNGPELSAAAPVFQSSLNASLNRSSAQDFRSSDLSRSRSSSLARSVVSDIDSTPRNSLHKSPGLAAGRKSAATSPRGGLISSSLRPSSGGDDRENVSSLKPAAVVASTVDEGERKRLASEALQKKFEARKLERGTLSKSFVREEVAPEAKEFRSSLTSSSSAAANSGSDAPSMSKEKEQRVNEHYNKLKQESAMKEAARRANGFKSSLLSSISATLATPASQSCVQKTCYVIAELQR